MIKPLYFYKKDLHNFIYNTFGDVDIEFNDISMENILEDFSNLLKKHKINCKISLTDCEWQEESGLIDLQFYIEEQFKKSWGSFFITWYKDTWECQHIWYSGNTNKSEPIYKDWVNK